MLNGIRSRLTYANVIATAALFLALGGGAYALSGIPDGGGVYHGCVDPKTGALRVVKSASACHKTRTVKRGNRRVRTPGESAIAWNQQGRPGVTGVNGANGVNGSNGANGATNVVVRKTTTTPVLAATGDANCNPGERAVGGGASRSDGSQANTDVIRTSFPVSVQGTGLPAPAGATPTAWHSSFDTGQATPLNITFYVICASP
jgi:hypothetical protein